MLFLPKVSLSTAAIKIIPIMLGSKVRICVGVQSVIVTSIFDLINRIISKMQEYVNTIQDSADNLKETLRNTAPCIEK